MKPQLCVGRGAAATRDQMSNGYLGVLHLHLGGFLLWKDPGILTFIIHPFLHPWYIYLHEWWICMVNVGTRKYTIHGYGMGTDFPVFWAEPDVYIHPRKLTWFLNHPPPWRSGCSQDAAIMEVDMLPPMSPTSGSRKWYGPHLEDHLI